MNNIQIQAFIKGLKKTKGRDSYEKRKHMDKTTTSDNRNVGIIGVSSLEQTRFRNETISVQKSGTTEPSR